MSYIGQYQSPLCFDGQVTIAVGQTESNAIDLQGTCLIGFLTPSNLTATTFTFMASADGVNYLPFYDAAAGSAFTTGTLATSKYYGIGVSTFTAIRYLKIVANTAQLTSDAIIPLVTRELA